MKKFIILSIVVFFISCGTETIQKNSTTATTASTATTILETDNESEKQTFFIIVYYFVYLGKNKNINSIKYTNKVGEITEENNIEYSWGKFVRVDFCGTAKFAQISLTAESTETNELFGRIELYYYINIDYFSDQYNYKKYWVELTGRVADNIALNDDGTVAMIREEKTVTITIDTSKIRIVDIICNKKL